MFTNNYISFLCNSQFGVDGLQVRAGFMRMQDFKVVSGKDFCRLRRVVTNVFLVFEIVLSKCAVYLVFPREQF